MAVWLKFFRTQKRLYECFCYGTLALTGNKNCKAISSIFTMSTLLFFQKFLFPFHLMIIFMLRFYSNMENVFFSRQLDPLDDVYKWEHAVLVSCCVRISLNFRFKVKANAITSVKISVSDRSGKKSLFLLRELTIYFQWEI